MGEAMFVTLSWVLVVRGFNPYTGLIDMPLERFLLVGMLPSVASAAAFAAVVRTRKIRHNRETTCRVCGYILRGISEPRCPECGERI
jgi:hypothetical protein